jgi:hypothetical protein
MKAVISGNAKSEILPRLGRIKAKIREYYQVVGQIDLPYVIFTIKNTVYIGHQTGENRFAGIKFGGKVEEQGVYFTDRLSNNELFISGGDVSIPKKSRYFKLNRKLFPHYRCFRSFTAGAFIGGEKYDDGCIVTLSDGVQKSKALTMLKFTNQKINADIPVEWVLLNIQELATNMTSDVNVYNFRFGEQDDGLLLIETGDNWVIWKPEPTLNLDFFNSEDMELILRLNKKVLVYLTDVFRRQGKKGKIIRMKNMMFNGMAHREKIEVLKGTEEEAMALDFSVDREQFVQAFKGLIGYKTDALFYNTPIWLNMGIIGDLIVFWDKHLLPNSCKTLSSLDETVEKHKAYKEGRVNYLVGFGMGDYHNVNDFGKLFAKKIVLKKKAETKELEKEAIKRAEKLIEKSETEADQTKRG